MQTFPSLLLLLVPVFVVHAKISFYSTIDGKLDEIYKVLIIAENPKHFVSFWDKNETDDKTFRIVSFELAFDLNTKIAGIIVHTPLDPNNRNNVDWVSTSIADFTAPPINFTVGHEFLYYFTVYGRAIYFTMPTTNGMETIIRSADAWFLAPPPVLQFACAACTAQDKIFLSKLDWGKKNEDVMELWQQAQYVNPNYGQIEPNIDEATRAKLNNFKDEI